ncbi:MAG: bifunctional precorrin-2 dehydrogenase/sirohydrochlorin ferrochelatase [Candidatus Omnitrophota bacterium]|nr:bifunctional precorrin-2 dehydrogenase/sirohydrochlorin ferrochelatase [Candidatus Omnitrophota bacterium]
MKELYYPIALNLKNKRTVVIGGGKVAERKVKTLLQFGARVRVVSPDLTATLERLFKSRRITWFNRVAEPSDVNGSDIVIAATSDTAVNKRISGWAKRQGILINVVDRAELSSFISPAILLTPKAVVAVYTHGRDPALSRDLKNFLKENWDVFLSYRRRLQKRPS